MRRQSFLSLAIALAVLALGQAGAPARAARVSGPSSGPALTVAGGATYENVTLFPVFASSHVDTSAFLTLEQGLVSGDVMVREMGDAGLRRTRDGRPIAVGGGDEVNRLVLINRGRKPLLLLAGELVSGGKQDRVIAKDRVVAPGAEPLPLDVFCVEHGRWTGASQFTAAKVIVHPSVREQAAVAQRQDRVWTAVREATTAPAPAGARAAAISAESVGGVIASVAPSESYAKVYHESRFARSSDAFAGELERRFRQVVAARKGAHLVGVIVAYGGEVAWSDVFASSDLFEQYWPKLLKSYVIEALARPATTEQARLDEARTFIEPLIGREQVESEPGVYRWRQVTAGSLVAIDLESLPARIDLHAVRIRRTGN